MTVFNSVTHNQSDYFVETNKNVRVTVYSEIEDDMDGVKSHLFADRYIDGEFDLVHVFLGTATEIASSNDVSFSRSDRSPILEIGGDSMPLDMLMQMSVVCLMLEIIEPDEWTGLK